MPGPGTFTCILQKTLFSYNKPVSDLFLPTKLYIPPQRPHLTPRPRLINQLIKGANRKLTIVAAPAGFGKTTLVTSWLAAENGRPAAWLSIDENDNDFPRFFSYLIAAAQTVFPELAQGLLSSLRSSQVPGEQAILPMQTSGLD